jgi:dihydropyrimidinase
MGITRWHAGTPEEMRELVEHRGVTSFKVYLAYKDALMIDDGELYQVMEQAARLGAVVMVHAENGDAIAHLQRQLVAAGKTGPEYHPLSRPSSLEGEATHRALVMARLHGATAYIVHMTCRESVEALERAKLAGQRCFGETCPQYLLLDDRVYARPGFESAAYVLSPPIRPAHVGHHDALWRGLSNGLLDVVATDHCPFLMRDKERGRDDFSRIPNGGGGVEDRLALLHTYGVCEGRFDLQRMVALGSTHPARIFGLHPRKGTVAVGSDADLVVFDPAAAGTRSAKTHHSRADRNLYEGMRTKGAPTHVIVGGEVRFADGRLEARRGAGRFIARRIEGTRVPHPVGEKEMGRVV